MSKNKKALILIVDDNPQNLQFLGNILSENGYEPAMSVNASKALEFLKKRKSDLILLDVMMPDIDGFEMCEIIKNDNSTKNIPVIFITAKTETGDIVKGFKSGAVDYVTKPFKIEELLARVQTHIDLKLAREEIVTLRGVLPICSKCKKVRDDEGYWEQIEEYITSRSEALFSHGLCPACEKEMYEGEDWYKKYKDSRK